MKRKQIVTRFERRRRLKVALLSVIIAIISMAIGAASIFFYLEKQRIEADKKIEARKKYVYLAKNRIIPGEVLSQNNLKKVYLECNMPTEYYMTEDEIGTMAVISIEVDMPILKVMCSSGIITNELREVSCEVVKLNDNLMENDFVDIRLRFSNGEDYIVLSKKSVHNLSSLEKQMQGEESCYLWMTEEEILNFSAAIVDAYLYTGSNFYTVKYLEPQLQEASKVTYIPRLGTLDMMKQYPEIIETAKISLKESLRKELENRLHFFLNQDIREIDWIVNEVEGYKTVDQNIKGYEEINEDKDQEEDEDLEKDEDAKENVSRADDENLKEKTGVTGGEGIP